MQQENDFKKEGRLMHVYHLQSFPLLLSTAHKLQQSTGTMSRKTHTFGGVV